MLDLLRLIAAVIGITVQHVIAPDVRFETEDLATRLLIPIIVLQNHNRYNIMEKGQNYSIDIESIQAEVKKMVHKGEDVGGSHSLNVHEKLAIVVSKAMVVIHRPDFEAGYQDFKRRLDNYERI